MKVFLIALMILAGNSLSAQAETVSTDKSDFAEIGSVIDDAAFDIRYYSPNNFTAQKNIYNPISRKPSMKTRLPTASA